MRKFPVIAVILIDALIVIGAIGIAIVTHTLWGLVFIICWQSIEFNEGKHQENNDGN